MNTDAEKRSRESRELVAWYVKRHKLQGRPADAILDDMLKDVVRAYLDRGLQPTRPFQDALLEMMEEAQQVRARTIDPITDRPVISEPRRVTRDRARREGIHHKHKPKTDKPEGALNPGRGKP